MGRLAAVVSCLVLASSAWAVDEKVALPSWFPAAKGYAVKNLKHRAYEDWTFQLPGDHQHVHGEVWDFDVTNQTPDAWLTLRAELEREDFKFVGGDAKSANPGRATLRKGEGEHATYVIFWNHGRLAIVSPAQNPFHVTLKPPARRPETFALADDLPYLAPIPGSRRTGQHDFPTGMSISTDCKGIKDHVGSDVTERVYAMPAGLTDFAAQEAYEAALRAAGWETICKIGHWTTAHYTRDGRDVWIKIVTSAPRDYALSFADTGADLRADLKKSCTASLYGVNFDFDKATLRPDAEPPLHQLLTVLAEEPKLVVEIGGHTDDVGKPAYNLELSGKRAAAVKAWLTAHGIAPSRLSSRGYGDTRPLVANSNDENRARNRRVEVKRTDCH